MPIASCLRCGNAFFARAWEGTRCPKCKSVRDVRIVTLEELAPWLREWFMSREPAHAAGPSTTGEKEASFHNEHSVVVHAPVVVPSGPAAAIGSQDQPRTSPGGSPTAAPALFDSRVNVAPIALRFWNERVDLRSPQGQREWLVRAFRDAGADPDRADLDATREKFLSEGPPDDWRGMR